MWSYCLNYWSFSFTPSSRIIIYTRFLPWSYVPHSYMLLPGILKSLAVLLCSIILLHPLTQHYFFFLLSVSGATVQCRPFAPHPRWGGSYLEGTGSRLRWGGTGEGGGVRHKAILLIPRKEGKCDSPWICLKNSFTVDSQQPARRFPR